MDITEVTLTKGLPTKREDGKSIQFSFELTIPTTAPEYFVLAFQNYYTASIELLQQEDQQTYAPICEPLRLMPYAHAETGAQDIITLSSDRFQKFDRKKTIKVILKQPVSIWNVFDIKAVKLIYKKPVIATTFSGGGNASTSSTNASSTTGTTDIDPENNNHYITLTECIIKDAQYLTQSIQSQQKMKPLQGGPISIASISFNSPEEDRKKTSKSKKK